MADYDTFGSSSDYSCSNCGFKIGSVASSSKRSYVFIFSSSVQILHVRVI